MIIFIFMLLSDQIFIFFTLLLLFILLSSSWPLLLLSLSCRVSKTHYIYVTTFFSVFFFVWRVIGFIWLYVPIELNSAVLAINSGTNYSPYNCILTSKKYAIFITIPVYDLWFVICIIFVCFCPVFVLCVHSTCTIILTTKPKLNWLII